ncbi:MAG: glycosyltransferase, partial [Nevskia sp.]|nr:glycosyltransferase [Nevskia sp.]
MTLKISVCIATYRRNERLALVLADLAQQTLPPVEVVVVDNHADGIAREVVALARAQAPYPIHYDIQPERNISLTRNRTVALATAGDWLAFIDDDERAPLDWLAQLANATQQLGADAVLAPVIPLVPETAPAWIRRGHFYDFPRLPTGAVVPLNRMRFGNVIIRGTPLRAEPGPFDASFGLAAGEDGDLLVRLVRNGARVVWCDEAIVTEPVEASRLSLRWLVMRALGGGQEFARKSMTGQYGPVTLTRRLRLLGQSIAQLIIASVLTVLTLP